MSSIENIGAEETSLYNGLEFCTSSESPEIRTDYSDFNPETSSVVLSDGSRWHVIQDQRSETINKITTLWKEGDDIRAKSIKISAKRYFVLKNVRTQDLVLTKLNRECSDLSKAFFAQEIDPSGYALKTQDGRMWVTGFLGHFHLNKWNEGDRLVINKSHHDKQDYEIIHVDSGKSIHVTNVFRKA